MPRACAHCLVDGKISSAEEIFAVSSAEETIAKDGQKCDACKRCLAEGHTVPCMNCLICAELDAKYTGEPNHLADIPEPEDHPIVDPEPTAGGFTAQEWMDRDQYNQKLFTHLEELVEGNFNLLKTVHSKNLSRFFYYGMLIGWAVTNVIWLIYWYIVK